MAQYFNPQSIDPYANENPTHKDVSFYDTPQEVIGRLQNREIARRMYDQAARSGEQDLLANEYKLRATQRDDELESDPEYQRLLRQGKLAGQQQVVNSSLATDISNRSKLTSQYASYLAASGGNTEAQSYILRAARNQMPNLLPEDDQEAIDYLTAVQNSYQYSPEYMQKDALADQKYAIQQGLQNSRNEMQQQLTQMRIDAAREAAAARVAAAEGRANNPKTPFQYMVDAFQRQFGRQPTYQEVLQMQNAMPANSPQLAGEKKEATTAADINAKIQAARNMRSTMGGAQPAPPPAASATSTKKNVIKLD